MLSAMTALPSTQSLQRSSAYRHSDRVSFRSSSRKLRGPGFPCLSARKAKSLLPPGAEPHTVAYSALAVGAAMPISGLATNGCPRGRDRNLDDVFGWMPMPETACRRPGSPESMIDEHGSTFVPFHTSREVRS